uniref:Uncharacterized protein n=1 Tax=Arundo donax TaxID=35708 RepID=A0A0A8Z4P6_ARUDO
MIYTYFFHKSWVCMGIPYHNGRSAPAVGDMRIFSCTKY